MFDYLNKRTPPSAIKGAIKIGDRLFDCVEIHRQWGGIADSADDVPRAPTAIPGENLQEAVVTNQGPQDESASLFPRKPCPPDTVPMRHYELSELEKYTTLAGWLNRKNFQPQAMQPGEDHEYAVREEIVNNKGMEAALNVWNPGIQTGQNEFSLMQTWVGSCTRNSFGGCQYISSMETIEAGWLVYPNSPVEGYGDGGPELFTYSTEDGYDSSCWGNDCSHWVKTHSSITPGMPLSWSAFEGSQRAITLRWLRDESSPNHWWLRYNGEWIGYFKNNNSWFDEPGLQNKATYYQVGGEIVNNAGVGHTATDMGSGRCPSSFSTSQLFSRVAYTRNIRFINTNFSWATTNFDNDFEDSPYDLGPMNPHGANTTWGRHFYLGGEGNSACP